MNSQLKIRKGKADIFSVSHLTPFYDAVHDFVPFCNYEQITQNGLNEIRLSIQESLNEVDELIHREEKVLLGLVEYEERKTCIINIDSLLIEKYQYNKILAWLEFIEIMLCENEQPLYWGIFVV